MSDFPELREIPLWDELIFHGSLIDVIRREVSLPDGRTSFRAFPFP